MASTFSGGANISLDKYGPFAFSLFIWMSRTICLWSNCAWLQSLSTFRLPLLATRYSVRPSIAHEVFTNLLSHFFFAFCTCFLVWPRRDGSIVLQMECQAMVSRSSISSQTLMLSIFAVYSFTGVRDKHELFVVGEKHTRFYCFECGCFSAFIRIESQFRTLSP